MLKVVSRHFHLDYLWELIQWFEVVWLFKYFSFSWAKSTDYKSMSWEATGIELLTQ